MSILALYILFFFIIFLGMPVVFLIIRFILWLVMEYCVSGYESRRGRATRQRNPQRRDRQANVFTVQDENSRESRYNDIFFIEPNSAEAARIRAQLEKDDKDLPSYEEVMRMTSVTTPTTTSAAGVTGLTASNASVNTTETILAVPPYSEVDPIAAAAATSSSGNNTSSSASAARTSTAPPPMPAAMVSTATDITHQASSVV
ncbi:uncharacterized protein LOC101894094 isoform X5 [Musca domestica]|uniref:Uncharacterized protein LOC101894094 isoform X5 n=1 Tax=Musca domestica TaxID=7370 RepID=A0A1I8MDD4_MUSDO|nr:uncharacterized protein LOC101894094 isoform X5 [Musca domestica]